MQFVNVSVAKKALIYSVLIIQHVRCARVWHFSHCHAKCLLLSCTLMDSISSGRKNPFALVSYWIVELYRGW